MNRTPPPAGRSSSGVAARLSILLPLLVALLVRVAAAWTLPYRGQVSDEGEYLAAATWLAQGRGFSFFTNWIWTRPPLYILFLATHIRLFGPVNLLPIRASQTLISVLTVALTMAQAWLLAPYAWRRRVALLTGWAMALSYSFATYAFLLLSETLFIALLMLGVLLLTLWAQRDTDRGYSWRRAGLLAAGGVVLGLASLTRGVLAGAMPLFAAWVWSQSMRHRKKPAAAAGTTPWFPRAARALAPVALLTVSVSAIILPWSLYNSRFFGGAQPGVWGSGLILIDTTGAYNTMYGAQAARQELAPAPDCAPTAARCEEAIYNRLITVPDHADRQALAYRTAWSWIGENPGGFLRKSGRELLDLLLVNFGGAERLYNGYTVGEVPAGHLLGLLLDDTVYVLAAPLAILGLLRRQGRDGKGLVVAWLVYNLAAGALFFAINRFRQPLLPFLFIYAACALAQLRMPWPGPMRQRLGYVLSAGLLLVVLPSFVYLPGDRRSILEDTRLGFAGLADAGRCAAIKAAFEQGDLDTAQRLHDAEARRKNLTCLALLQAQIWGAQGQSERALALLQSMEQTPERYLLEGDIFRAQGNLERARGAFVAQKLEPPNPTRWAWEHLHPPATTRIDLGGGLDWGYIDGFYGREFTDPADPFGTGFRWTGPHARLRFVGAGSGAPQRMTMRLRRPIEPPARLRITASGKTEVLVVQAEWQEVTVNVPATERGADVVVELQSTVAVPGPEDLHARQQAGQQLRLLGVQVDWAELR